MNDKFISIANTLLVIIKDNLLHRVDSECSKIITDFKDQIDERYYISLFNGCFSYNNENVLYKISLLNLLKHIRDYDNQYITMSNEMHTKLQNYFDI